MNVTEMLAAIDDHGDALLPGEVTEIRNALAEFQRVAWIFENIGPVSITIPQHGRVDMAIEGWADFRQMMNMVPRPPRPRP